MYAPQHSFAFANEDKICKKGCGNLIGNLICTKCHDDIICPKCDHGKIAEVIFPRSRVELRDGGRCAAAELVQGEIRTPVEERKGSFEIYGELKDKEPSSRSSRSNRNVQGKH